MEVAIGIVLVYLILSLVCTSLVEAVVSWKKLRPKVLEQLIQKLVGKDIAKDVYNDPDVAALSGPTGSKPSYIPTDVFA